MGSVPLYPDPDPEECPVGTLPEPVEADTAEIVVVPAPPGGLYGTGPADLSALKR